MKKNNKGFTLIELLAVIVILAVLILVALPAVTNLMQRSRKAAFRAEVLSMAREGVQLAYSANMVSGVAENQSTDVSGDAAANKVFKVTDGEYLCMTFDDLVNKGYIDKNDTKNNYAGYIQIWVPTSGAKARMYIKMTNGTYSIVKNFDDVANSNDVDTIVLNNTSSITKSTKCPTVSSTKSGATLVPAS